MGAGRMFIRCASLFASLLGIVGCASAARVPQLVRQCGFICSNDESGLRYSEIGSIPTGTFSIAGEGD